MHTPSRSTDRRDPISAPLTARKGRWQSTGRRFRFNRTIGFWIGAAILGTAGCILGVCMPYSHPVGVTISVLWWGIYLGCFGASIGALMGMLIESAAAARAVPKDIGRPRTMSRAAPSARRPEPVAGIEVTTSPRPTASSFGARSMPGSNNPGR
jgi:hypothetical protein